METLEAAPRAGAGAAAPPRAPVALVVLAFAAVYLFWGSTYLAMRVAVASLPPLLMAGCRFLLAGSILFAFARLRGAPRPEGRHWLGATLVGGLLLLGGNGGVVWAQQFVPSGLAALLVAITPLWMALFEALRPGGARPGRVQVAGLLAGFGGAALLAGGGGGGAVDPWGAAALVGASISWAVGSVLARNAPLPKAPLLAIALQMLCGGALQVLGGLAMGEAARVDLPAVRPEAWLAVAYLVVFGSLGGFVAYVWLLGVRPAAQVATYAYVNPVIAVVLGWAVLDEALTGRTLVGAAVIVASVALITLFPRRAAAAAAEGRAEQAI